MAYDKPIMLTLLSSIFSFQSTPQEIRHLHRENRNAVVAEMKQIAKQDRKGASVWRELVPELLFNEITMLISLAVIGVVLRDFLATVIVAGLIWVSALAFLFVTDSKEKKQRRRKHLRQALLNMKIRPASCVACHYDLRQIESPTCPECGEEVPGHANSIER